MNKNQISEYLTEAFSDAADQFECEDFCSLVDNAKERLYIGPASIATRVITCGGMTCVEQFIHKFHKDISNYINAISPTTAKTKVNRGANGCIRKRK